MAHWLYNVGIRIYISGIAIAGFFSPKAKQWRAGRRQWLAALQTVMAPLKKAEGPIFWMHCASLGEFEQGRPVIEALSREFGDARIVLTFFSPSGYEIRKNYSYADVVAYLPADTPFNAALFVKTVEPDLVLFVKYEFWYNYLSVVHQAKIPLLLIAAKFRPDQVFFKWYGALFRQMLGFFDHIFTQDTASEKLLSGIGLQHLSTAGDTRVDRVLQMAALPNDYPLIEIFKGDSELWIIGSSWPEDEAIFSPLPGSSGLPANWKIVVAPHQIDAGHLSNLEKMLSVPSVRYSQANESTVSQYQVMIIDNIGMLAHLYRYGAIAYIGGGFGAGIHNTLEPAAFGLPVVFGPRYHKFEEAVALIATGGFFSINNAKELQALLVFLLHEKNREKASVEVKKYLLEKQGATDKVLDYIRGMEL